MKFALLPLIALVSSPAAFAAADSIIVKGNSRTRTSYIERLVQDCWARHQETKPGVAITEPELAQCVSNARIFSDVKVAIGDGQTTVEVDDRWTFIALPSLSGGSGDSQSLGLTAFDSNFLGLGMTVGIGAQATNLGNMYTLSIADPSLFFTNWNYNFSITRQGQETQLYREDEIVDSFLEKVISVRGQLGYRFTNFSVSGSLLRNSNDYSQVDDYANPLDNESFRYGIGFAYDNQDYRLYFAEGVSFSTDAQLELNRTDGVRKVQQYSLFADYQKGVFTDHVIQITTTGMTMSGGTKADLNRLGGDIGFRGIESGAIWSKWAYAASFDYQILLSDFEAGSLTFAPFFDAGRVTDATGIDKSTSYSAYGGGIYFYLKDIAVPGLGIAFGKNNRFLDNFVTISLGLST